MGGWGISPNAPQKEQIKSKYADYLNGLNCCGKISYEIYCEAFDVGMELLDEMYELGLKESQI